MALFAIFSGPIQQLFDWNERTIRRRGSRRGWMANTATIGTVRLELYNRTGHRFTACSLCSS